MPYLTVSVGQKLGNGLAGRFWLRASLGLLSSEVLAVLKDLLPRRLPHVALGKRLSSSPHRTSP